MNFYYNLFIFYILFIYFLTTNILCADSKLNNNNKNINSLENSTINSVKNKREKLNNGNSINLICTFIYYVNNI